MHLLQHQPPPCRPCLSSLPSLPNLTFAFSVTTFLASEGISDTRRPPAPPPTRRLPGLPAPHLAAASVSTQHREQSGTDRSLPSRSRSPPGRGDCSLLTRSPSSPFTGKDRLGLGGRWVGLRYHTLLLLLLETFRNKKPEAETYERFQVQRQTGRTHLPGPRSQGAPGLLLMGVTLWLQRRGRASA